MFFDHVLSEPEQLQQLQYKITELYISYNFIRLLQKNYSWQ